MGTWNDIIKNGRKNQSNPVTNILNKDDIITIVATMDFFGVSSDDIQQVVFDLSIPKYRVFDWLGMGIMSRIENKTALKVLVYAFQTAGYNEKQFIDNLRVHDYQVETEWENVVLD